MGLEQIEPFGSEAVFRLVDQLEPKAVRAVAVAFCDGFPAIDEAELVGIGIGGEGIEVMPVDDDVQALLQGTGYDGIDLIGELRGNGDEAVFSGKVMMP